MNFAHRQFVNVIFATEQTDTKIATCFPQHLNAFPVSFSFSLLLAPKDTIAVIRLSILALKENFLCWCLADVWLRENHVWICRKPVEATSIVAKCSIDSNFPLYLSQTFLHIVSTNQQTTIKKHVMKAALKRGVETGVLVQVKASYKLSPEAKKEKPSKPKAVKKAKETTAKKKVGAKPTFILITVLIEKLTSSVACDTLTTRSQPLQRRYAEYAMTFAQHDDYSFPNVVCSLS